MNKTFKYLMPIVFHLLIISSCRHTSAPHAGTDIKIQNVINRIEHIPQTPFPPLELVAGSLTNIFPSRQGIKNAYLYKITPEFQLLVVLADEAHKPINDAIDDLINHRNSANGNAVKKGLKNGKLPMPVKYCSVVFTNGKILFEKEFKK